MDREQAMNAVLAAEKVLQLARESVRAAQVVEDRAMQNKVRLINLLKDLGLWLPSMEM